MKKDIEFPEVKGVQVAVIREKNEINEDIWTVYLINKNTFELTNILISSKGYGQNKSKEKQKTSVIRQHFDAIGANASAKIEPIDPAVFHLTNEYWVSYYAKQKLFDKKFIFVPDSIIKENLVYIPELDAEGILHS